MNNIIIKKISKRDIPNISVIANEAYLPEYKRQKLSASTIKELLRSNDVKHISDRIKGNYFFVAKDKKENKIIGFIGLRKDNDRSLHDRISTFIVLKEYQGKGVGSMLYKKVLEQALKLKIKKLVVKASLLAEPIYSHWRFKKIRIITKTYSNGDKYRNVWMEKNL
jgi:GNAT superfamily N-acetyltransferase